MGIEQFEPRIAFAVTPSFVADINLLPGSGDPYLSWVTSDGPFSSKSTTLTTTSSQVLQVFFADDGQHGTELWKTDGTTAGTQLLKDIVPGPTGSLSYRLFAEGGTAFFAINSTSGCELWKTDGTTAGTLPVKQISTTSSQVQVEYAGLPSGDVLFSAVQQIDPLTFALTSQLWKTDGTEAGTAPLIADNVSIALNPRELTSFGTHVLFSAEDEFGSTILWITDGTAANTVPVQTSTLASILSPRNFTVVDGPDVTSPFVIFLADDGAEGLGIWRYDDANGPSLVASFGVTAGAVSIGNMVRYGTTAVFAGDNGDGGGPRLWKTSGVPGDIVPIQAYVSPTFQSVANPFSLTVADKTLYFFANGINGGTSLWKSDGTDFGTFEVGFDLVPSGPLVAVGSRVYFSNFDGQSRELWKSDGTTIGIVREVNPNGDAIPNGLNAVALTGELLFAADDGVHGTELWKTDGTAGGTALLKDINAKTGDGIDAFSGGSGSYISAAIIGNAFYFAADDGKHGTELWKRDGDSAPVLVADLEPGIVGSQPAQFTVVGSSLYFTTTVPGGEGPDTYVLWVLPAGTSAVPVRLKDDVTSSPLTNDLVRTSQFLQPIGGDKLLFAASDIDTGVELWITGGTPATTRLVKDINGDVGVGSNPFEYAAVGSSVVFTADDGVNGRELWITDGSAAGTALLKDIFPGQAFVGAPNSGDPTSLTAVGGVVYFAADDGVNGRELWVTNGTPAGTRLVKNINGRTATPGDPSLFVPTGSSPFGFTALGGWVLFAADDGIHGTELWRTDGSANGTTLVKDINTTSLPDSFGGIGGSVPVRLTAVAGRVFFAADDGVSGRGLWVTDGTRAGTVPVPLDGLVDLSPNVGNLVVAGNRLFFTAEKNGQRVLLESDGTLPGTSVVELGGGSPTGFTGFGAVALAGNGRRFYFGVDDGIRGKELWQIDFPVPPAVNVVAVGTDGRSNTWSREFAYTAVSPTSIRVSGLTAIQSGFFSPNVALTVTPSAGLATMATKVVSSRYDARSRSVLVTLASPIPSTPTTGTLIVGLAVQPGARLIDTGTGDVVRSIATEDLQAAGYSAAFATRFQGGLRVAAADVDGNGYGDLAVAPGGVPDQIDPTQAGRKLAGIFGGSLNRVAIFDGTPTPSWEPVSIDVGGVFGAEGAGGYLVALGDVRADAAGSGVRELIVAAGRRVAVFDVLGGETGVRPVINPVPVQVLTMTGGTITSLSVGRLLGGSFDEIIVASNTAKGMTGGTTTVSLLDGATLATLRSFAATSRVESGPARNLVDVFGFGAQVTSGDFDGNSMNDLVLGAGANGLSNFRVIGGEFIASSLWFSDRVGYQAAINRQLGSEGNFSQVRAAFGTKWQPLAGPDFFSPAVPRAPLGDGFNAPVSVVAVPDGTGRAKLFAALGSTNQSGNVVRRFAFLGGSEKWVNDGSFEMRPESPGKPQLRPSIGLRLG